MSFQKMDFSDRARPEGRNMVLIAGFSALESELLIMTAKEVGIDECLYIDETRMKMIIEKIISNEKGNEDVAFMKQKNQVILFNASSQFEIQQFVTAARAKVEGRPLIAMVTSTSIKWTFEALVKELKQERFELEKSN